MRIVRSAISKAEERDFFGRSLVLQKSQPSGVDVRREVGHEDVGSNAVAGAARVAAPTAS
jgi:hypothetical protein